MAPALNYIRPTASAGFSTQTVAQVEAVEGMLRDLCWAELKDNVHSLRDLMNEFKTNHALKKPDAAMENQLANEMQDIQELFADGTNRDEANWRICRLKSMMKEKMYYA